MNLGTYGFFLFCILDLNENVLLIIVLKQVGIVFDQKVSNQKINENENQQGYAQV
jgi:hypothetical protein